jgi:hypothetical protein
VNVFLWVLQVGLALFCIAGGLFQTFKLDDLQKHAASVRALPRGLWVFLGAFGCAAGLLLILPGALNFLPVATPVAAAGVAVESVFLVAVYVYYGDHSQLAYSMPIAVVATFIAYGRFYVQPL